MNSQYFLKNNVIAEPLVMQWYAQPYLISPATAAMLIANSHIPIMESYIDDPETHETALQFPEMIGGPYIDYKTRQVSSIQQLLATTKLQYADALEFADGIKQLGITLKSEAKGYSLEPLYQKIPLVLKGYIELSYTDQQQATYRLLEAILYKTKHYLADAQSILLYEAFDDDRSFSLSTPRLLNNKSVNIKLPYCNQFYDVLFKARHIPLPLKEIHDLYSLIPNNAEIEFDNFFNLFTKEAPKKSRTNYSTNSVKVQYFGHACLLIETHEVSILVDPLISYSHKNQDQRFTYDDLPDTIDYLLITHNHPDHVLIEHLIQLRHRVKTVVVPRNNAGSLLDPSLKLLFKQLGFENIIDIDELETISIPEGTITGIPFLGEHGDLNIRSKTAYAIKLKERSLLLAADLNNLEVEIYKQVHKYIGNIDVLFISMECDGAPLSWLYGALLPNVISRSMTEDRKLTASDYMKTIKLINTFHCKQIYLYAMGQEPWLNYIMNVQCDVDSLRPQEINKLENECASRNLGFEKLFLSKEIIL